MSDPRERLIVALDVSNAAAAQKIVAAVGDSALTYKVGMQLYTAVGPQIVRDLVSSGRQVFLARAHISLVPSKSAPFHYPRTHHFKGLWMLFPYLRIPISARSLAASFENGTRKV